MGRNLLDTVARAETSSGVPRDSTYLKYRNKQFECGKKAKLIREIIEGTGGDVDNGFPLRLLMPAKKEKFFLANGSLLQERLIATSNGRYNGYRIFSAKELKKATNNYDSSCIFYQNNLGDWYKGCIEGRDVAIFVPHGQPGSFHGSSDVAIFVADDQGRFHLSHDRSVSGIMNNIAMAVQLSGHKNVAKLLGCCLHTRIPIVVYENVGYRNLAAQIHGSKEAHLQSVPMPWKTRLKIASDIAHTIAYLHTAFSRPIIHRSIEPSNIFLDEQSIPRLSNFSKSTTIPEGKVLSETASCSLIPAYLPPEFEITEKTDVYSFGVLLMHLLLTEDWFYYLQIVAAQTGMNDVDVDVDGRFSPWPYLKYVLMCHSIDEVVDHMIVAEGGGIDECQQWKAFVELAFRCLDKNKEERPTMVQVTKQLWQIQRCFTTVTEMISERSMILEKLIGSCNDRCTVIHRFSAKDLKKATDNYSPYNVFSWSKLGIWYKGSLDERSISVCKISNLNFHEHVKNELNIAVKFKAHENVLKLLGCCLETPCPALVYESAKNGTLQNQIHSFRTVSQPLLWSSRLKIARQIANGIAHLHTAFSATIIYGDLRLSNIFLDEHYVAKISNFCYASWIHEGETFMKHSTMGNERSMSSKYAQDNELSDKMDVYSFGLLLMHLLLGWTYDFPDSFINIKDDFCFWRNNVEGDLFLPYLKYYWECHSIDEVVETQILEEGELEQQQWQEVMELAFSCLETIKEKRPMMIEVAKQLSQIERPLTTIVEKEKSSLESTRMFMKELIVSYHGEHNSLCNFSAEKLRQATRNYRPRGILCCSKLGIWYIGYLGMLAISLCKISSNNWHEHVENEIKIAAQLSSHENVLKLLGSCIETPIPILVYGPVRLGTLFYHIHYSGESLTFKNRLMIARQIADEIAELHSAFSMPIIHRNIKSANIFLDGSFGPKLSNFSQAISIHKDTETLVTDQNEGTKGYMAPEYLNEGVASAKVDLYSFGVLLIELLIGSKLLDLFELAEKEGGLLLDHLKDFVTYHHVNEIVDPQFLRMEEGLHQQRQWEAMIALSCRCMETAKDQRPTMVEISRELKKI